MSVSCVINLFELASACLHCDSIEEKLRVTALARAHLIEGRIDYASKDQALGISATVFPDSPKLVDPSQLPRRGLSTANGRIALLHALAHIEFYAIHLAWDILYRFRGLPEQFCQDWLKVAAEEALHFSLLRERLRELGSDYGQLGAHRGLWDVATDTSDDLIARLALVPRTLEARGLDVTPDMIKKLLQVSDTQSADLLKRILQDEIGHVAIGSKWFERICHERGLEPQTTYFDCIRRVLRGKIHGPINHELRRRAGFDESELERLEQMSRESRAH